MNLDMERICRACRSECSEMRSIYAISSQQEPNIRLDEMLMACASVKIMTDDGMPQLICENCIAALNQAFAFRKICESTDAFFREYNQSKGVKEEEESCGVQHDSELRKAIMEFDMYQDTLQSVQDDEDEDEENVKMEEDGVSLASDQILQARLKEGKDFVEFVEDKVVLTCRSCTKTFTTLEGLKSHKRLHTGELYKCEVCDKQYTRQNHLQRHMLGHGRRKVHICKICNKTLSRLEHLKRHLITHMKNKPFLCTTCKRGFNRSEHLMNHAKRCKGDKVHVCEVCNKGFTRKDSLQVHMRLHEDRIENMPTLESLDNVYDHYIQVDDYTGDSEPEASELSDYSDTDFPDQLVSAVIDNESTEVGTNGVASLPDEGKGSDAVIPVEADQEETEIRQILPDEVVENTMEVLEDVGHIAEDDGNDADSVHSEYLPPTTRPKRTRGRPKKFKRSEKLVAKRGSSRRCIKAEEAEAEDELKEELVEADAGTEEDVKQEAADEFEIKTEDVPGDFACTICNKVLPTSRGLEIHARKKHKDQKVYDCKVCDKKFQRINHLKRHMIVHLESKPYICDICTRSFARRDHLTQHMKLHSLSKDYECETCHKSFARSEHLVKHMASKHNIGIKVVNEKKYKCTVCLKGFTTEKYRDVHMKSHTGEKKFNCKTCDKTFISKSHLTEHMKFHSDQSKKFLCSECGQRFIRNDYLVIHMRRHRGEKPFKCKYCGKGFPRTTDLTVHERYHTGEKTHLCTICGRGFGRAYNLTVHMRTHTGEKPYHCTYCEAAFAQGNDLKAHVRRHTGERFQCDICTESFLMGYLLTQHKRAMHGIQVQSNIRRLQHFPPEQPPPRPEEVLLQDVHELVQQPQMQPHHVVEVEAGHHQQHHHQQILQQIQLNPLMGVGEVMAPIAIALQPVVMPADLSQVN